MSNISPNRTRSCRHNRVMIGMIVATIMIAGTVGIEKIQQPGKSTESGQASVKLNDAVQFWCAGRLVAAGESPYDVAGQTMLSAQAGWDRDTIGGGKYDFMPFYYPHWAAVACVPLSFLPVTFFTAAWTMLQVAAAILAAIMLMKLNPNLDRWTVALLVCLFPLTIQVATMGQVINLLLLGLVCLWWCCEKRHDIAAGFLLALLCTKPQVSIILVPVVLCWAYRQARPKICISWGCTLASLASLSLLIDPSWIIDFLRAPRITPMVTQTIPGLTTTWASIPGLLGITGVWQVLLIAPAAVAAIYWSVMAARRDAIADVISASLLAIWCVSPYGRSYDYVVLLLPLIRLLSFLNGNGRAVLLFCFGLLPHMYQLIRWRREEYTILGLEVVWSWFPILLAAAWIAHQKGYFASGTQTLENSRGSTCPSVVSRQPA